MNIEKLVKLFNLKEIGDTDGCWHRGCDNQNVNARAFDWRLE
jgi:hypothetical protein